MNTTSDHEAAQARAALRQAENAHLSTDRDRRVHAAATAGFGVLMGVFVVVNALSRTNPWISTILTASYVVALLALAAWQKRSAHTVPRNSRIIGLVGLTCSAVLTLTAIVWLNVRQGDNRIARLPDQVDSWWVYLVAGFVIALPMLVSGALIARGQRSRR